MKAEKYIILPVIAAVLCACLFFFMPSNGAETGKFASASVTETENAKIDIVYGGKTFSYADEYIEPTDHTVAETIQMRKINKLIIFSLFLTS